MLAITGDSAGTSDRHDQTVRRFMEHARAVAAGEAEGDVFTWFLASEYQWEMEAAGTWLVESPASRLSATEKDTMRHFMSCMPAIRDAIIDGRKAAAHRADRSLSPEWTDWLELAALPSWNDFTIRTAILLSQLGEPARNDPHYGIVAR
ncbi:hypothetical protein [Rhodanobacter lindaniclasticus]|uniref:Uncharacterized protein n=1 Tax=Rhodanobacter lindaniclasticus TaxID=75310 RepID=A0A4S3KIM4_9GAMM|nr:hypothetical protein [Rhodanobacter lindaniclasticus]THD08605.1 hypothetical protein B1991_04575 [Rhodanobacter lindaniclasticus]